MLYNNENFKNKTLFLNKNAFGLMKKLILL